MMSTKLTNFVIPNHSIHENEQLIYCLKAIKSTNMNPLSISPPFRAEINKKQQYNPMWANIPFLPPMKTSGNL